MPPRGRTWSGTPRPSPSAADGTYLRYARITSDAPRMSLVSGADHTVPPKRIERDSMGPLEVPEGAYYGASTMRAHQNFPISGERFDRRFIWALGQIKWAAADANKDLGLLD